MSKIPFELRETNSMTRLTFCPTWVRSRAEAQRRAHPGSSLGRKDQGSEGTCEEEAVLPVHRCSRCRAQSSRSADAEECEWWRDDGTLARVETGLGCMMHVEVLLVVRCRCGARPFGSRINKSDFIRDARWDMFDLALFGVCVWASLQGDFVRSLTVGAR